MTAVTTASLSNMGRVPIDQSGRILTYGLDQFIVTVAGNGSIGYSGDNGAATSAKISNCYGFDVDGTGDIYFADTFNNRVRKVTMSTGIITTIAGTGFRGNAGYSGSYSGDNGAATSAELNYPYGVAVDGSFNVYIADFGNQRIRKVTVSTGIITTIAGTGTPAYSGDNGAATSAQLRYPADVAVDGSFNVYIADTGNKCIRKITTSTGMISTIAGTGRLGYSGDNGAATSAQLSYPYGVTVDASGNVYIADTLNQRVRKITVSTSIIITIAGTVDGGGYNGDNRAATRAQLYFPSDIAVDGMGNVYIADSANNRIRKVTVSSGNITTIAGNGTGEYNGDIEPRLALY